LLYSSVRNKKLIENSKNWTVISEILRDIIILKTEDVLCLISVPQDYKSSRALAFIIITNKLLFLKALK
jgi:hypothetical protein